MSHGMIAGMPTLFGLKITSAIVIFLVTIFSAYLPFKKRLQTGSHYDFPAGEAFASGVFLGAALIHMLGDAARGFSEAGFDYPYAFFLCGFMFLALLFFEHLTGEVRHQGKTSSLTMLMVIILSVHAFLEGAALGLGMTVAATAMVFMAIVTHKWAESFSLAIQINRSLFPFFTRIILFLMFGIMTPLGVFIGNLLYFQSGALSQPIFEALAAGTFLYIGTLHGLSHTVLNRECCNLHEYLFVIFGFLLMAFVAIWT